jgi:uncharacterized protein YabN with tetrapyrrole methylase and pyrophosphatase domain
LSFICPWRGKFSHKNLRHYHAKEIYNLLNFISKSIDKEDRFYLLQELISVKQAFNISMNIALAEKQSPCRFVDDILVSITDENEIKSLEETLNISYINVKNHIYNGINRLNEKNYNGCVSEASSALESFARITLKKPKFTLGKSIKPLCDNLNLDSNFSEMLNKLWGIVSNNCRHSQDSAYMTISEAEAKFFLLTCSSIINYMLQKQ